MKTARKTTSRSASITARDIMSPDVIAVAPELSLCATAARLRDNHITGAAVVNTSGKLIGVVSETDIVEHDAQPRVQTSVMKRPAGRTRSRLEPFKSVEVVQPSVDTIAGGNVADVFSPYVVTAAPDATVPDLAAQMVRHQVHRVFIVDGKSLIGVVSSMDVMKAVAAVAHAITTVAP